MDQKKELKKLTETILSCDKCSLSKSRIYAVPGIGHIDADILLIGESPGFEENEKGIPFIGKSGKLLQKILKETGIDKQKIFVTNICKCRPTDIEGKDRKPRPDEIKTCIPYLYKQIEIICPKFIITLGNVPVQLLINAKEGITKIRGKFDYYNEILVMPTFHPSYVLRNGGVRSKFYEIMTKDIEKVRKILENTKTNSEGETYNM